MITNTQLADYNKRLKEILSKYLDSYQKTTEASRTEHMKTLPAGAPVPSTGIFYDEFSKNLFARDCDELMTKARGILQSVIDDYTADLTEAPSTDAVNSISLLKMREHITEDDINNLLERYGDNVQVYDALVSIAHENKIYGYKDHPTKAKLQRTQDLMKNLERTLTLTNAESGHTSAGYIALLNAIVDNVFPSGEDAQSQSARTLDPFVSTR